jgi:hypothetical protein
VFVIFEIGSIVYAQANLYIYPAIYMSHIDEMTDRSHHVQLLIKMGSLELFAHAGLEPPPLAS